MSRLIRFSTVGLCFGLLALGSLTAQPVSDPQGDVGIGTNDPHPSALLDMTSNAKGFLLPRMTSAQRLAIPAPANGLMVYDITVGVPFLWSNASGGFQWDAVVTTGSNLGWLTNGNGGLVDGVNNFFGTNTAVPVRVRTNNTERIRIEADGDVGINTPSPSAKLDVVATVGAPAIEANTASGTAIYAQSGAGALPPAGNNWGVFVSVPSGPNNAGVTGVAGFGAPINNNAGISGANDGGYGVAGNSVATGFAGVFGNATSLLNPAAGVLGRSAGGSAGRFEITNGANGSNGVEISTAGAGDALEVTTTGGGLGIDLNGGALDGNAAGNALGAGTAAQQLTVRGNADAVIGNTLAGNPTVWDLVVQGDAVTTGIFKVGGSIWIDGVSPTHQINANAPLNIGTSVGDIAISPAGGTTTVNSDLVVTDDLIVNGAVQFSGGLTLPSITEGSVLFAGTSGAISQDNTNFFWDDATNRLGIGTNSASAKIDVVETGTTNSGIEVNMTNGSNGARGIDVNHAGVGQGVFSTSTGGNGVEGITSSISAAGVIGRNTFGEAVVGLNRGGNGVGAVVGRNDSSGYGVRGFNTKNGIGVIGQAGISGGTGTAGRFENVNAGNVTTTLQVESNGIGSGIEVDLPNSSNGGRGIDVNQAGVGPGVFSTSIGGNAVWGITSSISAAGVIGDNTFGEAVVGRNRGGLGVGAVVGRNDSSGYGVRGFNTKNGYGVIGQAGISGGTGTAGRFENVNAANTSDALQVVTNSAGNAARFTGNVVVNGNLTVSGTVAKGGGSFMIDHPLDPENKILYHSFVESPDMKNINDGVVKLDDKGEAWVELPNWFQALNGDFRYQLTAIGAPGPGLYVAEEIADNRFKIAGGKPGMKVSWMVTGIRHDPYAVKHRIQVEVEKTGDQKGQYLHPDAYGVKVELNADILRQDEEPAVQQNQSSTPAPSTTVQEEMDILKSDGR
ncbi:MAG: hypothetical protein H6616_12420 [Ignavibacteria bacterium]|nr:hypothetical protein [Ignavibacteria bacterium]